MDLATRDPRVKTQLFRFVDVLPVLRTNAQKTRQLLEYLSRPEAISSWPFSLSLISSILKIPGVNSIVADIAQRQVTQMAHMFIVGDTFESTLPKLEARRRNRLAFTLDILGESVLSDAEAEDYRGKYFRLIERLGEASANWRFIQQIDQSALGPIPKVNLSIKISSLDCRIDPMAFESSMSRLIERLTPILRAAMKQGFFINFDMEQYALKDLTRELFRRLILSDEFRNYRYLGIVVQAYLRSSLADIEDWISVARERGCPFTIRLVKGAYWDYEVITAEQNGWSIPVFDKKSETDLNYEACARVLIDAYPSIELALGSHNVRSISSTLAYIAHKNIPLNSTEIQMLYGMADPFKKSLIDMGVRVREYDPMGELVPGLSYLVRRLLENSANDSFLKQTFLNRKEMNQLLAPPR